MQNVFQRLKFRHLSVINCSNCGTGSYSSGRIKECQKTNKKLIYEKELFLKNFLFMFRTCSIPTEETTKWGNNRPVCFLLERARAPRLFILGKEH